MVDDPASPDHIVAAPRRLGVPLDPVEVAVGRWPRVQRFGLWRLRRFAPEKN